MTQVYKQSTVGEQGRVYSRRRQTEQNAPAPAGASATAAVADAIEMLAFRDLDVGELLLEQFGPVYVADANFDLVYVTDGFVEFSRDAWGFDVDLSSDTGAPTPLRNVLEGLAETGHFEPIQTEVRRSGGRFWRVSSLLAASPPSPAAPFRGSPPHTRSSARPAIGVPVPAAAGRPGPDGRPRGRS